LRTTPALLAIALVAVAPALPRAADRPSLEDAIRRVTAYVEAYGQKASIVVATERSRQTLIDTGAGEFDERVMVADFAIVKAEANHTWIGFRDVIEVDGMPVPDRENRLIDVLTSSSGSIDEARRISDESARFNIGGVLRNFNVPTTVLFFFNAANVDRFRFSRKNGEEDATWQIEFREVQKPTLIRTPESRSVPAKGTIWVNPLDGTVVRTRLQVTDFTHERSGKVIAENDVRFQRIEAMEMWLPEVMDETYVDVRGRGAHVTGHAEYSNYRRFQTSVRIR
jgi:hypothetical protein